MARRSSKAASPGCAVDVLPPHLAETRDMAESLYACETGRAEIHLRSEGFGIMAGSAPPAVRLDGRDDTDPTSRVTVVASPFNSIFLESLARR